MTKLSVNVNKLATLRNSREKNLPDVLKMTQDIIRYGAEGITVHPRPDGRHIRKEDVYQIARAIKVEFNMEGYPADEFLNLVKEVKAAQCTLVPDAPDALTSNAGWKVEKNLPLLQKTIADLHHHGIRTSLFMDPFALTDKELLCLKLTNTDRVELYTEAYADNFGTAKGEETLTVYKEAAKKINQLGIALNAGHDLNLYNLRHFVTEIPTIEEVSIGHALIVDALEFGMKETIEKYLACLR